MTVGAVRPTAGEIWAWRADPNIKASIKQDFSLLVTRRYPAHSEGVTNLLFFQNGIKLASCSLDGGLVVRDMRRINATVCPFCPPVTCCSFRSFREVHLRSSEKGPAQCDLTYFGGLVLSQTKKTFFAIWALHQWRSVVKPHNYICNMTRV